MAFENDNEQADLSSFRMTNEEARLLGNLARKGYDSDDATALGAHTQIVWTKVEEIITGFENR